MVDRPVKVLFIGSQTDATEAVSARLGTRAFEVITVESYETAGDLAAAGAVDVVMVAADEALTFSSRHSAPVRKLPVRKSGHTMLLNPEEIVFIAARNKTTFVHVGESSYIIDSSLDNLENRLRNLGFLRVHRSCLINIDHVRQVHRDENGYSVTLDDAAGTNVRVSRRQSRAFRQAIEI